MGAWPRNGEMKFGCGIAFWPFWWRLQFRPETELERIVKGFSWHIGPFSIWADFH